MVDFKPYFNSLEMSERIFLCYFSYNVKQHSEISSHCSWFALSDDHSTKLKDDSFVQLCPGDSKHQERCSYCDAIPTLFKAIEFAIKRACASFGLSEDSSEDMLWDLAKSKANIYAAKFNIIRNFCQSKWWEELQSKITPNVAFLNSDFAMTT